MHFVDDVAVEEGTFSGTHEGVLHTPSGDVPPTGRAVSLPYIHVLRFRDGLHVSFNLIFDRLLMLEQLGLIPAPRRRSESQTDGGHRDHSRRLHAPRAGAGVSIDLGLGCPTIKVGAALSGQVEVAEGEVPPAGGFRSRTGTRTSTRRSTCSRARSSSARRQLAASVGGHRSRSCGHGARLP